MGFEPLMIEEEEKEGVGDLVRPKFVPTLHIGLKIGKVQNIDTSSTCFPSLCTILLKTYMMKHMISSKPPQILRFSGFF